MSEENQARNLFVYCQQGTTRRETATLLDRLEALLKDAQVPALVLSYGGMQKVSAAFISIEYYQPLPRSVLDLLMTDETIISYVTYAVASLEQEQQAKQQAIRQQAVIASQESQRDSKREPLEPPMPPDGFQLLTVPVPLLTTFDDRWIARATGPGELDGPGYLIYEHLRRVVFLPIDEAIVVLAAMSEESRAWIEYVHAEVSERHQHLVDQIRSYWWMLAREVQSQEGDHQ